MGCSRGREQTNQHDSLSPGSRDSVYMRLDTIPAALRDLSNHYQTSPVPPVVKRSRSRVRKIRTLRLVREAHLLTDASPGFKITAVLMVHGNAGKCRCVG
jgi:hypothetical protein